ncbi:MAG TPA: NAD(P)-binding protein, partial [Steroidobacteraceae bacterium]|nr:NAD(P)-binding protein [Steroidobacteraceae bacterium]
MNQNITRRDFIDGVACAIVAGTAGPALAVAEGAPAYPPALNGLRGSRAADFAVAHRVRDGAQFSIDDHPVAQEVDCAVVGAGIGGLAAAYFVHQARPRSRVLVLDNHDDFGGHARRNEFQVDGRLLIGYGGSESIQSPHSLWSPQALHTLKELGIDLKRFESAIDTPLYPGLGLSCGLFFAREDFGVDRLVTGDPQRSLPSDIPPQLHHGRPVAEFWADCPLSEAQRRSAIELYTEKRNVLPGLTRAARVKLLERTSYADFLTRYWELDPATLKIFLGRTRDLFALSADQVPALWAAACDLPGFQGLDLGRGPEMSYEYEPYIHHFPDGNASIARLFVRRLVPAAAPGSTMEDIVTTRVLYEELDRPANPVRIRLSCTVVKLRNRGNGVDLLYVGPDGARRIRCRRVIYTAYGTMFRYLCDEAPASQRDTMAACVRLPLVYTTVALRNWQSFVRVGVHNVVNPTGFFSVMKLDYPVSLGSYRFAHSPDEPILLHLSHIPQPPAPVADRRASIRAARGVLYQRPFSDFENAIRDEVTRVAGPGGFNADRDIAAITVNRWGHGYAYDLDALSDPDRTRASLEAAAAPVGRISLGGSDAAWDAYA